MSAISLHMNESPQNPASGNVDSTHASTSEAAALRRLFENNHERLSPGLRRFFLERTNGKDELADELCQRAWTLVWRATSDGRYDPARAAYSTFVYAVAQNVWLQHLRQMGRKSGATETLGDRETTASTDSMENIVDDVEIIDLLRRVLRGEELESLSDQERWILTAVAQGETDRGLAAQLQVSASTANARKNTVFDKLRRFLAAKGHREDSSDQQPASSE